MEKGNEVIPIDAILRIGEKIFDRVMPDENAAAEAKAKLLEAAQKGKLKELEMELQDRSSARDRETQIATSAAAPLLNTIVTPLLALGTVQDYAELEQA